MRNPLPRLVRRPLMPRRAQYTPKRRSLSCANRRVSLALPVYSARAGAPWVDFSGLESPRGHHFCAVRTTVVPSSMRVGRFDTPQLLVVVLTSNGPIGDHGPDWCTLGRLSLLPGGAHLAPGRDSLEDWTQSTMGVGSGFGPPPPAPLWADFAAGGGHCARAGAPWCVGFSRSQMPRDHALGDAARPRIWRVRDQVHVTNSWQFRRTVDARIMIHGS